MFSKPEFGWVNISIDNWTDRASYLTSPHLDMLDALINLFSTYNPQCILCDAEGWEYYLIINFDAVFVIKQEDTNTLYSFDKRARDIADEVISDIEKNIYEWSLWNYNVENDEEIKKEKEKIEEKIKTLKNTLNLYDKKHKR